MTNGTKTGVACGAPHATLAWSFGPPRNVLRDIPGAIKGAPGAVLGLLHLMNSATTGAVLGAPRKTKVRLVLLVWRHALLARWMGLGP